MYIYSKNKQNNKGKIMANNNENQSYEFTNYIPDEKSKINIINLDINTINELVVRDLKFLTQKKLHDLPIIKLSKAAQ